MTLKERVLELRAMGLGYTKIAKQLNCSRSVVAYHSNPRTKEVSRARALRFKKTNPLYRKIDAFLYRRPSSVRKIGLKLKVEKALYHKINQFLNPQKGKRASMKNAPITVQEVLTKFGSEPKCYLTGTAIDLSEPSTYSLDHMLPYSKGGTSTLDNLGLTTQQANFSKCDMTPDEFYDLCKKVVAYREKQV